MMTLEDGKRIKITHYRITEELATTLIETERRLRDLANKDAPPVTVAKTRYEMRQAGGGFSPHGGFTVAEVYDGDTLVGYGQACCRPDETFSRALGRLIATNRALNALKVEQREAVH